MSDVVDTAGPFHEGELAVQRETGERSVGASNGRIIVDRVIPHAVGFIARQELAVVATIDGDGQPWASALLGPAGSFTAPEATRLRLDRTAARADDPLWSNLQADARIGLLFIEVESRRRYRVNGRVADPTGDPLVVDVGEAFPNCPKYISRRHVVVAPPGDGEHGGAEAPAAEAGTELGDAERRIIAGADVFFVASANPTGFLDASHRGGHPGFVQLDGERLVVPDYPGNGMFNTLGNLRLHPPAGLLFIDFAGGQTLQLTGTTTIDLTHRTWTFTPTRWRRALLPARLQAELLELSPFNP